MYHYIDKKLINGSFWKENVYDRGFIFEPTLATAVGLEVGATGKLSGTNLFLWFSVVNELENQKMITYIGTGLKGRFSKGKTFHKWPVSKPYSSKYVTLRTNALSSEEILFRELAKLILGYIKELFDVPDIRRSFKKGEKEKLKQLADVLRPRSRRSRRRVKR